MFPIDGWVFRIGGFGMRGLELDLSPGPLVIGERDRSFQLPHQAIYQLHPQGAFPVGGDTFRKTRTIVPHDQQIRILVLCQLNHDLKIFPRTRSVLE